MCDAGDLNLGRHRGSININAHKYYVKLTYLDTFIVHIGHSIHWILKTVSHAPPPSKTSCVHNFPPDQSQYITRSLHIHLLLQKLSCV